MAGISNKLLKALFEEAHFDKDNEVKEIEEMVKTLVHAIAKSIGKTDRLFRNFVLESGSFYEDLKAFGPDEFDFMICLKELSKPGVCKTKDIPFRNYPDPGYVDVQLGDTDRELTQQRCQRYISRRENVKSDKLLKRFEKLLKDAFEAAKRGDWGRLDLEHVMVELRKIPVTVRVTWKGDKYQNYEISIDFVLCIKMNGWPKASNLEHRFNRAHPGYNAVQQAIQAGYHLVASTIGESGKARPCWRLSFSMAEGIVLKSIFKEPKLMHKAAIKILKVIRKKNEHNLCLFEDQNQVDFGFSYSSITWAFHSYAFKTMFLHEWFEFPEDSFWTENNLSKRICGILKRIQESLVRKDIRSFWVPEYKLFDFRARGRTRTQKCEEALQSLIDLIETIDSS